jgi:hypothetical protein
MLEAGMAYLAVPLLFVALVAGYGYLRFTSARARERAGLPARVRVKLPLYWWAFMILVIVNSAFLFLRSHGAP